MLNENDGEHKYGCLMLNLNIPNWEEVLEIVDKDDLYTEEEGFGYEKTPHVTVLYGLHSDVSVDDIKTATKKLTNPAKVLLTGISAFKNDKFEVVKFTIKSSVLVGLNMVVKQLPHTNTFPEYIPHTTIAYVKPGCSDKYCCEFKVPFALKSTKFEYSTANGDKVYWDINDD